MDDQRLQSVHLEGLPRREEFRVARSRLRDKCGDMTVAGELKDFLPGQDSESPTCVRVDGAAQAPSRVRCFLQDGASFFPLRVGLNSVGRLPDNDVVIADPSVSRRHCAILIHSDLSVEVHDVASKNGTLLNGRKLTSPTRLSHGDTITLCDRHLSFRFSTSDHVSSLNVQKRSNSGEKTQIEV